MQTILNKYSFLQEPYIKDMLGSFSKSTGLYIEGIDKNGESLIKPTGIKRSEESYKSANIEAFKWKDPYFFRCHAGLVMWCVPIIIDNNNLGSIICGQVLLWEPDKFTYEEIKEFNNGILNFEELKNNINKLKVISADKTQAVAEMMSIVVNYIVKMSGEEIVEREKLIQWKSQIRCEIERRKKDNPNIYSSYDAYLIPKGIEDISCCIDSPNPKALKAAIKVHKGIPMINSITAEKDRYEEIVKLVTEYGAKIVALTIDDENGISESDETRIKIGVSLIENLVNDGVNVEDIYIDPLIQPISTGSSMGIVSLNTIAGIKGQYPKVHFMCGLSNISFGLPQRGLLNRTFLAMCMHAGLDGAVLDPGNKKMMSMIISGEALLDKDRFTKKKIKIP